MFLSSTDFFSKSTYSIFFRNLTRVSNRLDQDQGRQNVGPDLGPNCLQRLVADDTSRQRVIFYIVMLEMSYYWKLIGGTIYLSSCIVPVGECNLLE